MMMMNHFFHLVNYSPWPIVMSLNLVNLGSSAVVFMTQKSTQELLITLTIITLIKFLWWRDIIREALYEGCHTKMVKTGISMGMVSFIVSELCFFMSFFWMYFYLSLSPDIVMGLNWPPSGVEKVSFTEIPLLNTIILLSSGLFITWSHYSMMVNKFTIMKVTYMTSIMMGVYFFMVQMYEYYELSFDFSDSAFSSSFFILTGFHGIHVMVGIVFITVNFNRMMKNNFSMISLNGFEYSAWYWHFVDVVWLYLYMFVYWWGM